LYSKFHEFFALRAGEGHHLPHPPLLYLTQQKMCAVLKCRGGDNIKGFLSLEFNCLDKVNSINFRSGPDVNFRPNSGIKTPGGLANKIKIATEPSRGGVLRWGGRIELSPPGSWPPGYAHEYD